MKKIVLNGFGRIGRCIFKLIVDDSKFEIVQVNDPYINIKNAAYLIKYDSIFGKYNIDISIFENYLIVKTKKGIEYRILFTNYEDIRQLNTSNILIEASSIKMFENLQSLNYDHIYLTKWFENADCISIGEYTKNNTDDNRIISCGICDTTALVPFLSKFCDLSIKHISIVTLHPFLAYQNLLDGAPRDVEHVNEPYYQIGRSSINSIIPKASSVDEILRFIFPEYADRISFMTYRVPTEIVTLCDISIVFEDNTAIEKIENIVKSFDCSWNTENVPLVSKDYIMSDAEYEYDGNWTMYDDKSAHFTIWYNNELGYATSIYRKILKDNS